MGVFTPGSQDLQRPQSRSAGSAASLHARIQGLDTDSLPLHWRQNVEDSDVPSCALFDHPCPVGPPPGARWGHASAAVGDRMFIFGGDGPSMQSNGYIYDTGTHACFRAPPMTYDGLRAMQMQLPIGTMMLEGVDQHALQCGDGR